MSEHYDFHYQPTGSGAISGQQVLQQTEDAINELGDYVNDNVGGAMDVAQQALETAQNAETNAQTALDTANSFSSAIQSAQQDASTALSTAQTAQTTATNANNTAIQAQQDASSAVTTANNASGQVSTLSGTVTALGQRVTTAEGNIGQNTSDITALTTRVGTAEGNITTLQNDVTIAQGNASSAMATAGQVKQQAYVFRYSSTALVASSTNSNTLLDNIDNLKVGDKVIDSSGVLFSITAIDTQNSTFTIGTALIDLAQDSDVVHKSGDETVGGVKTFADTPVFSSFDGIRFRCAHNSNAYITFRNSNQGNPGSIILSAHDGNTGTAIHLVDKTLIPYNNNDTDLGSSSRSWKDFYSYHGYFRGQQQNDEYSGNARTNLTLLANRDTLGQSGCLIDTFRENTSQGTGSHILGFGIKENSVRYEGCRLSWFYDNNNNGYVFALRPTNQGSNQPIKYELGTSSVKWSTINGVEPSALGMPDLDNGIDISSYITVNGGNKESLYTPPSNGWISVRLSRTSGALGVLLIQGGMATSGKNIEVESGVTTADAMLPVVGGVQVSINSALADGIVSAYFFPCLGNV